MTEISYRTRHDGTYSSDENPGEHKTSLYNVLRYVHQHIWFYLTDMEYKVLMFIIMRTACWGKQEEYIPESHFLKGVYHPPNSPSEDAGYRIIQPVPGKEFSMPIGRATLFRTLKSLEAKGLIEREQTYRATKYKILLLVNELTGEHLHKDLFKNGQNIRKRQKLFSKGKWIDETHIKDTSKEGEEMTISRLLWTEGGALLCSVVDLDEHATPFQVPYELGGLNDFGEIFSRPPKQHDEQKKNSHKLKRLKQPPHKL